MKLIRWLLATESVRVPRYGIGVLLLYAVAQIIVGVHALVEWFS